MNKEEIDARVRNVQLTKKDEELVWILAQIKKKMIEIGKHLEEIRDKKLYEKRYDTFEEFCRAEFGFGNKRANQLIAAEGLRALLAANPEVAASPDLATNVARMNEAHLRVMAQVPEPKRIKALKKISKIPGVITAAKMKRAAGITIDAATGQPDPAQPPHCCPSCGHRF